MDAEPRFWRGPRSCLEWETTLVCRAGHPSRSQPSMSLGANSRRPGRWPGCPVLVQGRSAAAGRAELGRPHPAPPHPHGPGPAARGPGPPLMPAMAVTSLLAPRPGRWPGDPRRAAAARQHPEVHAAALPPAARAGAWGRARPVWGRPPSSAAAGPAGTCGAALCFPSGPGGSTGPESRSPRGLGKRSS